MFVLAATISSDGFIRVFDLTDALEGKDIIELEAAVQYDTKQSRLTCMSVCGFDPELSALDAEDELEEDVEDEDEGEIDDEDDALDTTIDEDDAEDAEDSDEELARLEEEVQRAREAGLVIDDEEGIIMEGDEDEEDEEDEEGDEDEEDEEDEDEEGDDDDDDDDDDEVEFEDEEEAEEA